MNGSSKCIPIHQDIDNHSSLFLYPHRVWWQTQIFEEDSSPMHLRNTMETLFWRLNEMMRETTISIWSLPKMLMASFISIISSKPVAKNNCLTALMIKSWMSLQWTTTETIWRKNAHFELDLHSKGNILKWPNFQDIFSKICLINIQS